jgi:murein DD-endopeptidase MepM/ murein hydrolase activator NlpD
MKTRNYFFLLFSFVQLSINSNSQVSQLMNEGGGEFVQSFMDDLHPSQRNDIQKRLDQSIKNLNLQNNQSLVPPSFIWPMKLANGITDPGFYEIGNYIDHNPAVPNLIQDYNCGTRSYDLSNGYNHPGTDIGIWPFAFYKMDNNQVEIIAAAAGTIIEKDDGNFDKNCNFNNPNWNAVYLQHADGTITWYGHMKNGSLTTKLVGQTVAQGEYLGIVGSSGSSTGVHLHFEVHSSTGAVIDPWNGPCNSSPSMWASQEPYRKSTLNKIMTGSAPADFPACPATESPNEKLFFCSGNLVYASAFYRDQQPGQTLTHKLIQPNGVANQTWSQSFTDTYNSSWWWYSRFLPNPATAGTWKYQITYLSQIYEAAFTVSTVASATITPSGTIGICSGSSLTLTANSGNSYTWSTGATTKAITVNAAGTYTVAVNNGCGVATSSATTVVINSIPNATAANNGPVCQGNTLALTGGGGNSYEWTGVNGFTSSSQSPLINNIQLNNSGTYTVKVTGANGCTKTASTIVTVNPSSTYYLDADHDTYGVSTNTFVGCAPSGNFSATNGNDCNDNNAAINPGQTEQCGNNTDDNCNSQIDEGCPVILNLKIWIDGFYSQGHMPAILYDNNLNPGSDICDTLKISLHEKNPPHALIESKNVLIKTDGTAKAIFAPSCYGGEYYIKVNHRNSIEIWSKNSMLFNTHEKSIDFTR